MAKVIFNAKLSKESKEYASGIMLSIKGKRDIGVIDLRKITYKDQHVHHCGVFWDEDKHLLELIEEEKQSNANIGVFISAYPTVLVEGRVFISEWIDVGKDIASVCYKRDLGGYSLERKDEEDLDIIDKDLIGIKARNVALYLTVGSASDKLILKNSEGFYFICDFQKEDWFVLPPNASELELYDYDNSLEVKNLFKEKLPFPALDRKLYDEEIDKFLNGEWDLKKHTFKYV